MSKTIAIAGMGWLGRPLAYRLQTLGYKVKGSVTSQKKAAELRKAGYEVLVMEVTESGISTSITELLDNTDILVIMIPPGLRKYSGSDYVLKMTHLYRAVEQSGVSRLLFVSSTSVYGDQQGKVTEKISPAPENEAGRQLLQVEQLFFTATRFRSTIVRFGGLIGGSRQPVRYLAGRVDLRNGKAPVNLIHRDDCIGIITAIIGKDAFGHIFNAVMPQHPTKESYYGKQAKALGLEPPQYAPNDDSDSHKQVDSVHVETLLEYSFKVTL